MFPDQGKVRITPIKCFKGLDMMTKKSMVYINWSPRSDYLVNYNETTVSISKFCVKEEQGETLVPGWVHEANHRQDRNLNTSRDSAGSAGRKSAANFPPISDDKYHIEIDKHFSQVLSIHHRRRV